MKGKRTGCSNWKAKQSWTEDTKVKLHFSTNVENCNSSQSRGKANVCAPKRPALRMRSKSNFRNNNAANCTTKDMDDGVMLVVASKLARWEPVIQRTPRRRRMIERKVWRAGTGVTNRSTETTLDQKHRVAVANPPQMASVDAPQQVAPSTVPEQPAGPVMDIDAGDSDMPQLCSEYVKDIYAHLMDLEVRQDVRPGYLNGCDITAHMRSLMIGWLILLRSRFHLTQETLYLSVAIMDRFLQVHPVSRKRLQLVGVTAMLLAAKYEEKAWWGIDRPKIQDFANVTDNTFTPAQIRHMERLMLTSLDFELGRPVPLHFLKRATKATSLNMKTLALSNYLMELTLLDYDMVHYRPSEIAAASLCLSQVLDGLPWTPTERHYTTYDETHLEPIMQHIAKNVVFANEGRTEYQVVQSKYSGTMLMSVALLPELHSPVMDTLAAPLLPY